ncbi:MAG: gamma-glutamylcyclotransferase family protein [Gammaproteobacteria bacterium]
MQTIRYLAYGSNLHPARISARLGEITLVGTTELLGWALRYHKYSEDGSGKCDLIADPSSIAYGAVYEFSRESKQHLDTIEGVGCGYIDTCIELPKFGPAWVYLAQPSHIDGRLIPYDWYHAFVSRGAQHHNFPAAYIDSINRVAFIRDPNEKRRADNMEIANSIAAA